MCRKLFFLVSFLVVLGLASNSWADVYDIAWNGDDPCDNLWSSADNWDLDRVPADGDIVMIRPGASGPNCVVTTGVAGVAGDTGNEWGAGIGIAWGPAHAMIGTIDMDGGSVTNTTATRFGFGMTTSCVGTLNMSGGTINTGGNLTMGFSWGGHGQLNMTGGLINVAGWIEASANSAATADIHLDGGTIAVSGAMALQTNSTFDITNGTLTFNSDQTGAVSGWIAAGSLVAFGDHPRAQINSDFGVTTAGKTTITASMADLAQPWLPVPSHGSGGHPRLTTMAWSPGDYAPVTNGHNVYLGTADDALVLQAGSPQTANSYDPGPLDYDTTYYWQIGEVNALAPGGENLGPIWSFSIKDHDVVDDFESYTNDNDLWAVWVDGYFGTNGSWVYLENATVHDGGGAMEIIYDNDGTVYDPGSGDTYYPGMYSEAYMDLTVTDGNLARGGAVTIDLWFKGSADNDSAQLYFGLEDDTTYAQVDYADSSEIEVPMWLNTAVELASFTSVDATAAEKLYIGLGIRGETTTPGGQGTLLIDDIRIYPPRCLNPDEVDLTGDLNGDCVVDWKDMAETAGQWLESGMSTTP